jgi:putative aldouronate transport system substrate-binding protein
MKHYTRVLAIFMMLLLSLTLFAGCNGDGSEATATPPAQSKAPVSAPPEETDGDGYVYKMPIVDDSYTLTGWRPFTSTYITSPNEILSNIELEKRTNVRIEWQLAPRTDEAATQYNLMIASGNFTDMIFQGIGTGGTDPDYIGGIDKAIDDNIFLELTGLIEKYMPNLKGFIDSDAEIDKQIHSDLGNIGYIAQLRRIPQPSWMGPGIRIDYLEKVGISKTPETYDELYDALKKFKSEMNIEQPLIISYMGYNATAHSLTSGFDVDPGFYNENGTVKFGFIEQGFRDYLEMMNKWYSEGLIDQEFYTRNGPADGYAMDRIPTGKVGATDTFIYTLPGMYKNNSEDPDFFIKAMPFPRKSADSVAHFRLMNYRIVNNGVTIPTTVTDAGKLEIIARWADYLYSEEGERLNNYGVEGETYTLVDGKPMYTDAVLNAPDGTSPSQMMQLVADIGMMPGVYDWTRDRSLVSEEEWSAMDIWGDSASGDWVMPWTTLTSEEGSEYSNLYSDIQTLVTETIAMFITGQKQFSEYDAFIGQLKNMNIDRCIEIQQAALDRYLAR